MKSLIMVIITCCLIASCFSAGVKALDKGLTIKKQHVAQLASI